MAQKLPKMAQKLAPAKKNSRDISPVSPTFCISEKFPPAGSGTPGEEHQGWRLETGGCSLWWCWVPLLQRGIGDEDALEVSWQQGRWADPHNWAGASRPAPSPEDIPSFTLLLDSLDGLPFYFGFPQLAQPMMARWGGVPSIAGTGLRCIFFLSPMPPAAIASNFKNNILN